MHDVTILQDVQYYGFMRLQNIVSWLRLGLYHCIRLLQL